MGLGFNFTLDQEKEPRMRKFVLAAAFAVAATGLSAGGMDEPEMDKMAEPMMEPEMMEPEGDSEVLLPVLLLLAAAALALN